MRFWVKPGQFQRFALGGLCLVVGGLAGCSGDDGRPAVYPVQGRVAFRGQAPAGALVVLHPLGPAETPGGEPLRPAGQVGDDGSFRLTTFASGDGAPAGEYAVTVEWFRLVKGDGGASPGPNVIPGRYGRAETTPVRVRVAEAPTELETIEIRR